MGGIAWVLVASGGNRGAPPGSLHGLALAWRAAADPLATQALMVLAPLAMYRWRWSSGVLDGYDLGALSAAAFTITVAAGGALAQLGGGLISPAPPGLHLLALLNVGFVTPIVNLVATGLLCAAVWLLADPAGEGITRLRAGAVGAALGSQLALGMLQAMSVSTAIAVAAGSLVAILLAASSRRILGALLAADASPLGSAQLAACHNCYRVAPQATFCGQCGSPVRLNPDVGAEPVGPT